MVVNEKYVMDTFPRLLLLSYITVEKGGAAAPSNAIFLSYIMGIK